MVQKRFATDGIHYKVGAVETGWDFEEIVSDCADTLDDAKSVCGKNCKLELACSADAIDAICKSQVFDTKAAAVEKERTCKESALIVVHGLKSYVHYIIEEQQAAEDESERQELKAAILDDEWHAQFVTGGNG